MNSKISFALILFVLSLSFSCSGQKTESTEKNTTNEPAPAVRPEKPALSNGQNISVAQLADLMKNEPNLVILDVRTPQEVAAGYVEGAEKINLFDADFNQRVAKMDKKAPTAVYCKVGGRSAQAMQKMKAMGFENVYNVTGGFNAWKSQGHPHVTD